MASHPKKDMTIRTIKSIEKQSGLRLPYAYGIHMAEYVALLSKDRDSDYGVDFPDFPGCVTAGETPEEARELALEALCVHIEGMIEDGEPMPSPSPIEKIRSDGVSSDAVDVFLVRVPDDLIILSRQHSRKDHAFKMESCDLSWKNVDTL